MKKNMLGDVVLGVKMVQIVKDVQILEKLINVIPKQNLKNGIIKRLPIFWKEPDSALRLIK